MKSKTKKTLLISSIALLGVAIAGTAIGISVAGFERKTIIKDPTTNTNLSISGQGTRLSTYYLDLGTWGTIDNTGYSFWALVFEYNGSTPTNLKYIKGSIDGYNYRFNVDRTVYNRIKFFRTSSTNDSTLESSTTYQHSYYTSSSPGMATDATGELEFSSGNVTYQVTGWHDNWIDAPGYWR